MPAVASEVGGPLAQCKRIQMVSDGDGPVGASKVGLVVVVVMLVMVVMMRVMLEIVVETIVSPQITGEVLEIMSSLPTMVKAMTGVDITSRAEMLG